MMVLDDDEGCLQLAAAALTHAGFEVEAFSQVKDFIEGFDRGLPAAVVLDRRMPGDSGDLLACRLRATLGPLRPPVILWTADPSRETEAALLSGIIHDFVVKGQQCVEVLVQRVINHSGWEHVGRDLLLRRKDATVIYRDQLSCPLTEREVGFLAALAAAGTVTRPQGRMMLLDGDAGSELNLNRVVSRFAKKLPRALRAKFLTVRGKGWRLEL